jgi:FixJ family two-component response regulator
MNKSSDIHLIDPQLTYVCFTSASAYLRNEEIDAKGCILIIKIFLDFLNLLKLKYAILKNIKNTLPVI